MPRRPPRAVIAILVPLTLLPLMTLPFLTPPVAAERSRAVARALDPDPGSRESMRLGWTQVLKPALQTPVGWQGSLSSCDEGSPSPAAQQATARVVNYIRDLVGVEPVVFSSTLSAQAQEAALMMARNEQLSHAPPSSWACYTGDGAAAAAKSNLYLGRSDASAITGYMDDPGAVNTPVGHRRWIIDPRQTTMGSGSVDAPGGDWRQQSHALLVIDPPSWQSLPAGTPAYLPWPVAGYVPVQIEPEGRWSLSASDPLTDFSQASVLVNGSAAGVTVHPVKNGYGPPTVVWNFRPGFKAGDEDRKYDVVVSGIRRGGASLPSYSYTVTLFDGDAAPPFAPPSVTRVGRAHQVSLTDFSTAWRATDSDKVTGLQTRSRQRTASSRYGEWAEDPWEEGARSSTLWQTLAIGTTVCESARARDEADHVSDWTSPTCVHTPIDDSWLLRSSGWDKNARGRLWFGSATASTERGSTLTMSNVVNVTRLGVVATRCTGCGKVAVMVGRKEVGTISLDAARTRRKSVLTLPALNEPRDGTVKVVVLSRGRQVEIDGLVASQD